MDIQNVNCFAILDKAGMPLISRIHKKVDLANIFSRIKNNKDDITLVDDELVIYKNLDDIIVVIVANSSSNEIFMLKCLDAFYAALLKIMNTYVDKETILKNYDFATLVVDAFVLEGIIMEDDAEKLIAAVGKRSFEGTEGMKIPKNFISFLGKGLRK